jgi:hypothetical protein
LDLILRRGVAAVEVAEFEMARVPVSTGGGSGKISRTQSSIVDGGVDKRISYVEAHGVGFKALPNEVLAALACREVLVGVELSATSNLPQIKRRPNGSHYQLVVAWWASTSRFVSVDARRELAPAGVGKLRPCAPWSVTAKIYRLPAGLQATTSTWRFAGSSAGRSNSKRIETDDPLEVLPPGVADPVRGGMRDAWRQMSSDEATETVVGSLVTEERVRVLRAVRRAASEAALERADWSVETLEAPVLQIYEICVTNPALGGAAGTVIRQIRK